MYIHGMRMLVFLLFCSFGLQAQISTLTLNNVKPIDQPQRINFEINDKEIYVTGLSQLFEEAESRFRFAPTYIDCENCAIQNPTVVYTIVLDYTFGNAAGSKSAALVWRRSSKNPEFPIQGLRLTELSEDQLISQESFLSTLDRGVTLYVRMKELRGHVLNNGIHTNKKVMRLGKLFRTP